MDMEIKRLTVDKKNWFPSSELSQVTEKKENMKKE
jgi:hypothetical protein